MEDFFFSNFFKNNSNFKSKTRRKGNKASVRWNKIKSVPVSWPEAALFSNTILSDWENLLLLLLLIAGRSIHIGIKVSSFRTGRKYIHKKKKIQNGEIKINKLDKKREFQVPKSHRYSKDEHQPKWKDIACGHCKYSIIMSKIIRQFLNVSDPAL